jgi:hypothetical protein
MIPIPCQDFSEKQTRDHEGEMSAILAIDCGRFSHDSIIAQMFAFPDILAVNAVAPAEEQPAQR